MEWFGSGDGREVDCCGAKGRSSPLLFPSSLLYKERKTNPFPQCMGHGLKNLQTSARASNRRQRNLDTSHGYADDSAVEMDGLDADYDADGRSSHSGVSAESADYNYGGHGSSANFAPTGNVNAIPNTFRYSTQERPFQGQRLPSIDMGIGSMLNQPSRHGRGNGQGR